MGSKYISKIEKFLKCHSFDLSSLLKLDKCESLMSPTTTPVTLDTTTLSPILQTVTSTGLVTDSSVRTQIRSTFINDQ